MGNKRPSSWRFRLKRRRSWVGSFFPSEVRPARLPSNHAPASKTMRHSSLFDRYQELQRYVAGPSLRSARDPTAEKKAEHFSRIERHVELADGVISALSNFSRMSAPQPRPFSVGACIREVLSQTGLPETVEVALVGLDPLPTAAADARQIQILFSNLFRNARGAMSGNGRLTITGGSDGPFVEIDVTDTGPGIPPDQIARVMEPFFTTKARGLGLGLAISRSIVERNQGELRVISEPGSGSTFLVRLPAASPPARHAR